MEEPYKIKIKSNFIQFITNLRYLQDVFDYSEKYRIERQTNLSPIIVENNYTEFIERFGKEPFEEYCHLILTHRYVLLHSIFIAAYSTFELQIRDIAEELEKELPAIKIGKQKDGSMINHYRKYLHDKWHIANASEDLEWQTINNFREIRNDMVHSGSRLTKACRPFLLSYNVVFSQFGDFTINDISFLTDFLSLIKEYIHKIVNEIAPVIPLEIN